MNCAHIAVRTALLALAWSAVSVSVSGTAAHANEAPKISPQSVMSIARTESEAEEWPKLAWVDQTDNLFQARYRKAADRFERDWAHLPQSVIQPGRVLAEGDVGLRVLSLRRRLGLPFGYRFDRRLGDRIAQYRRAHSLRVGRTADSELIDSLNRGYASYRKVIEANIQRLAALPGNLGDRFLLVDSTEQMLHMYEDGRAVSSMRVVVGRAGHQTPVLSSKIDHVVLTPYWNVPPDLTRDLYAARAIKGGKNYLDRNRFEVLADWSKGAKVLSFDEVDWPAVQSGDLTLRLRQRPGPGNGMGEIKFMFANGHGVYLHDTPSKHLFGKDQRLFSAGCVRLERPWELAEWLFGHRPKAVSEEPEQRVALPEPVPIHLVYMTAIPNGTGFDFREDVYNLDDTSVQQPSLRRAELSNKRTVREKRNPGDSALSQMNGSLGAE